MKTTKKTIGRRLASLLLMFCMTLSLLPTAAMAATSVSEISNVAVTGFVEPKAGEIGMDSFDLVVPADSDYFVSCIYWWEDGILLRGDDWRFETGHVYRCEIILTATSDALFTTSPTATLNGKRVDITVNEKRMGAEIDRTFTLEDTAPKLISSVKIFGFEQPILGKMSICTGDLSVPSGANYYVDSMDWRWSGWNTVTILDGRKSFPFEEKKYTCIITLKAKDGYEFERSPSVTIKPANTNYSDKIYTMPKENYTKLEIEATDLHFLISKIDVSTSVEPKVGMLPNEIEAMVPSNAGYFVLSRSWREAGASEWLDYQKPFAAGHTYEYILDLDAVNGIHKFEGPGDLTAAINGKSVKVLREAILPNPGWEWTSLYESGRRVTLVQEYKFEEADTPPPSFSFKDVPTDAWYYANVKLAYEMGLINGKSSTSYAPKDNMSYAEAIKLAACMHQRYKTGKVTLTNGSPNWYDSYVDYAKKNGIPWQYSDYNAPISRADYVHIFYYALPASNYTKINNVNQPGDLADTNPYVKEIMAFYLAGILTGMDENGTFAPNNFITRAEVATILARMMDNTQRVHRN